MQQVAQGDATAGIAGRAPFRKEIRQWLLQRSDFAVLERSKHGEREYAAVHGLRIEARFGIDAGCVVFERDSTVDHHDDGQRIVAAGHLERARERRSRRGFVTRRRRTGHAHARSVPFGGGDHLVLRRHVAKSLGDELRGIVGRRRGAAGDQRDAREQHARHRRP